MKLLLATLLFSASSIAHSGGVIITKTTELDYVNESCPGEKHVRLSNRTQVDCLTETHAIEYDKAMLDVFLSSDKATIELGDLVNSVGVNEENLISEEFVFHYTLLVENRLISRGNLSYGNLRDMGIIREVDRYSCSGSLDIRLSQSGHDFASSLNNKEVFEKLKENFREAPFKSVFDGGQKLLEHFLKKKMDKLLEED